MCVLFYTLYKCMLLRKIYFLSVLQEFVGEFMDEEYCEQVQSMVIGSKTVGQLFRTPFLNGYLICALCGFITKFRQFFIGHISKHLNINPVKCRFCHRTYNRKGSLERHVKTCHKTFWSDEKS